MIGGRATPAGTARRAGGRSGNRRLGTTDLTVSLVGFGGYRSGRANPEHRAALVAALDGGVTLIDTSTNYQLGDSERLVGEVLAEQVAAGRLTRDEIVVVTKIGYVQGPNLDLAREREADGRPFPEMVTYMDDCWHCIHPEYLDDQLERSRERLGLETIDVLLLHNPEYFLMHAARQEPRRPLAEARAVFYDRLAGAFAFLDRAVAEGRIAWYGVSSNTSVAPADDPEATSVSRLDEAAGGRMAVLQLPYNLLETGALLERNTPEGTALDAAAARDLGVLVNRPLNAMGRTEQGGGRLIRLADPPTPGAPGSEQALRARVVALGQLEAALASGAPGVEAPRISSLLIERWDALADPRAFLQIFRAEIVPAAQRTLNALVAALERPPDPKQLGLIQAYQDELNALVGPLQARATRQDPCITEQIKAVLRPHLPEPLRNESLSRIAISVIASTPGVTSVLVGMRTPAYAEDALGVMTLPPVPDVRSAIRSLTED